MGTLLQIVLTLFLIYIPNSFLSQFNFKRNTVCWQHCFCWCFLQRITSKGIVWNAILSDDGKTLFKFYLAPNLTFSFLWLLCHNLIYLKRMVAFKWPHVNHHHPAHENFANPKCQWLWDDLQYVYRRVAGAEGLEPPTFGFGDRHSTNWIIHPIQKKSLLLSQVLAQIVLT